MKADRGSTNRQGRSDSHSVARARWGSTADGAPVDIIRLASRSGASVEVLTYGATVRSVRVPDRSGHLGNVVLGLDSVAAYEADGAYLGATIGRYANRIAGAEFELDGERFQLVANEGPNNLHGGPAGFHRQLWDAAAYVDDEGAHVELALDSVHGDGGFPGNLTTQVHYRFVAQDDGRSMLEISYRARCDRPTVCNLTNHSYFDLSAGLAPDVLDHVVQIDADATVEVDASMLPTGKLRDVASTPLDFRRPVALGARIGDDDPQLLCGGYDHTFVLCGYPGLRSVASVVEPITGRWLTVETTEPGLQLYSGNNLAVRMVRMGERMHLGPACGFETQHYSDSPNQADFPSVTLRPDTAYRSTTVLQFGSDRRSANRDDDI